MSATAARSRLLAPATLAALDDLELASRLVVEGFLAGEHLDRRAGAGIEFSQYRSYEPGDDPRTIDWRVYGRSDRYLVREAEVERELTLRLIVDATGSMAHEHDGLAKFDVARILAAAIAYLADRQGDRISLHTVRDGDSEDLPPQHGRRSLGRVLHRLETVEPAGIWPGWDHLGPRVGNPRERELVVFVGDLHEVDASEEAGGMATALRALRAMGQEVIVFHLMARDELEFDYTGDLALEDLESGEVVHGRAEALRPEYLRRLEADLSSRERRLTGLGVHYQRVVTDEPFEPVLRALLLRRRMLP